MTVLDGDDGSFRASRGNFGLVWVQSKGMNQPRYAQWSQQSAAIWAAFAEELGHNTGTTVPLEQKGGYDLHFSEETLQATVDKYNVLKSKLNGDYPFEVLGHNALRKEEPNIGPKVVGAIPAPADGHANPLKLLMALAADVRRMGGRVLTGKTVTDVTKPDGFRVACADGTTVSAGKIVTFGGSRRDTAGPKTGVQSAHSSTTRASPDHRKAAQADQPPVADRTAGGRRWDTDRRHKRGSGARRPGHATRIVGLAAEAIAAYPALAMAQLVRSWGALRILSPDGLPIYQESPDMPGAYLVTCHSGITLAAAHARLLPDWLEGTKAAPDLEVFSEARFAVS